MGEMTGTVSYDKRDRIAFVTLNRPVARTRWTAHARSALPRVGASATDDGVDVALLTGVGDSFCAGADLRTYVLANYVDARPSRVREIVDLGFGGLTRGLHRSASP